jgi:peptide/nickel transport system substrate-binding protein
MALRSPSQMPFTLLALLLLLAVACGGAATTTPQPTATPTAVVESTPTIAATSAPISAPTSQPTGGEGTATPTPYAYAARASIQELDEKFPFPPPQPQGSPRRGGVLHIAITGTKSNIDPVQSYDSDSRLIYDQLLEWEASWFLPKVQTTPTIRKSLAEDWDIVDLSTWDFHLRKGVTFQDLPPVGGREMKAQDVKYSYDLLKDKPGYIGAGTVDQVEVLDDYSVRLKLKLPLAGFPMLHTDGNTPVIVPREAVEADGGLGQNPVGTGPFIVKDFAPGEGVLLVRNPNYFMRDQDGEQLPYLDGVRLIFTRDFATQAALFRTQEVDMMRPPTLDQLSELLDTVPDAWLYRIPSFGWGNYSVLLDLQKEPFNNEEVRQALSMAINRDIVKEVINRGDATLYGPFPWALAGFYNFSDYNYENLGPNYQYNPQRAKELLAEAGYPDGFEMTMEFTNAAFGYSHEEFAVLLKKFFEDIGGKVNLKPLEYSTWNTKRLGSQPFEDSLIAFTIPGSGPTALDWIYNSYYSKSPPTLNYPHIDDPEIDAMLDKWRESPPEEQLAIQKQLWQYLTEKQYRITTIVPPHYRLTQSYVQNAAANPYCWFTGFCTYEAKITWLTDKAPERTLDQFAE